MKTINELLSIDAEREVARISEFIQGELRRFRKSGAVVGISGGIDSSVVLGLAVRALGAARVIAITMPERESDPESEHLAGLVARKFGVEPLREDITNVLEACRCYARRDEAVGRVFPAYDPARGDKVKIGLPQNLLDEDTLNVFSATVVSRDGSSETKTLPPREYLQIVAASNFKQRQRMATLYYHAERANYLVLGTANKNEHEQGFFVKYGDSGVDIHTIAHLYKTRVYDLARHLGVPQEIQSRPPTTDTYSAPTNQEEFFFRLPFATMDALWCAQENGMSAVETAAALHLAPRQVERAYNDFAQKKRSTDYLRAAPNRLPAESCALETEELESV
jgi:NAD+ synthase